MKKRLFHVSVAFLPRKKTKTKNAEVRYSIGNGNVFGKKTFWEWQYHDRNGLHWRWNPVGF